MAGIYIVLALITAVLFLLTRKSKLTVTKNARLVIRLDLVFLSIQLTEREKTKNQRKKKKKSSPEFRRKLISRTRDILSKSELEIKRIYPGNFFYPKKPSQIPLIYLSHISIYAFIALLSAHAKKLTLSPDALSPSSEYDADYVFVLKAPLIILLYAILLIRYDKISTERKLRGRYVGNENG